MRRLRFLLLGLLALGVLVVTGGRPSHAWTAPGHLNTNAATDSGGDFNPQVATDGLGNWVTVWGSGDDLGGTIDKDYDFVV